MHELIESPIEEDLMDALAPHLHEAADIVPQKRIKNTLCNYRVDFFAKCRHERAVIECDGREFHDYRADLIRDENILRSGAADSIVRFRGCDLHHDAAGCVHLLQCTLPWLFDSSAKPRTFGDLRLSGVVFARCPSVKAIARLMFPLSDAMGISADDARWIRCQSIAAFGGRFMVQLISHTWSNSPADPNAREKKRERSIRRAALADAQPKRRRR